MDKSLKEQIILGLKEFCNQRLGNNVASGAAGIRDRVISSDRFNVEAEGDEVKINFKGGENIGFIAGFIGGNQELSQNICELRALVAKALGNREVYFYVDGVDVTDKIGDQLQLHYPAEVNNGIQNKLPDEFELNEMFQKNAVERGEDYDRFWLKIIEQKPNKSGEMEAELMLCRSRDVGLEKDRVVGKDVGEEIKGEDLITPGIKQLIGEILEKFGIKKFNIREELIFTESDLMRRYNDEIWKIAAWKGVISGANELRKAGKMNIRVDKDYSDDEARFDGTEQMDFREPEGRLK